MDVRKNLVERLKQAEEEATKLRAALGALDGKSSSVPRVARRRKVSAATRQKMSAAQKARRERAT